MADDTDRNNVETSVEQKCITEIYITAHQVMIPDYAWYRDIN